MNYAKRRETWERCWADAAEVPGYFSEGEYEKFVSLRSELFTKYLVGAKEVSEFGCGTGHNLVPLQRSGAHLRGFDWSLSAVTRTRERGIEAEMFDMLHPDMSVDLHGGAVLTVHALEQLGADWRAFLDYLLLKNFSLAIHIEPIAELYDESARDQARLAYHRKRGYLVGYLTELRSMAASGNAELLEVRKSPFGGKDHDAYSVVVWRPL